MYNTQPRGNEKLVHSNYLYTTQSVDTKSCILETRRQKCKARAVTSDDSESIVLTNKLSHAEIPARASLMMSSNA